MITQYECQACGWIYPPRPDNSADKSASLMKLPENFTCPLCGVGKSEFRAITTEEYEEKVSDGRHDNRQQVVIVGAGLAGWSVVDAIRNLNKEVNITLIAADSGHRYHKPMLSAAFSQQKTAEDLIRFTAEQAAEKADIRLLTNTSVLSIDSENQRLLINNGELSYDKLILAVGAFPAIPPTFNTNKVWHINDIDSFNKIEQALSATNESKHIAIIGAGMVGTEIAEDLTKSGHKISLIDMNTAPLALMLPEVASSKIKEALTALGIDFIGNSRVDRVIELKEGGYQLSITDCSSGVEETLKVDHILVSTGLKVEEILPKSAGLDFDRSSGIAVQEATLQTSNPNIYAIGDCMSISGIPCRYVAPLRAQATTIANHILGQQQANYEHQAYSHKPPMIRLKNKSISVSATGIPRADESKGKWRVVSDTQSEVSQDMILEQVTAAGEVVATVTVKQPTNYSY